MAWTWFLTVAHPILAIATKPIHLILCTVVDGTYTRCLELVGGMYGVTSGTLMVIRLLKRML
jgi:hypothetical protein